MIRYPIAHWCGDENPQQWEIEVTEGKPLNVQEVFGGAHPTAIDKKQPLKIVSRKPLVVEMLPGCRGGYFIVHEAGGKSQLVASQRVPLQGAPNFRDFGGYPLPGGRMVRWGKLFRSGHLSALNSEDLQHFENLGLGLICDFRRLEEQRRQPANLPSESPPRLISLPIAPGSAGSFFEHLRNEMQLGGADQKRMIEVMREVNVELFDHHAESYRKMFRLILEERDSGGILINCTAGKDRTGFGAALILSALGASRAVIMYDYMLTARYISHLNHNKWLKGFATDTRYDPELFKPMLEVRTEYLSAAFEGIDKRYGNVDAYLRQRLKLSEADLTELGRRFTDPADSH